MPSSLIFGVKYRIFSKKSHPVLMTHVLPIHIDDNAQTIHFLIKNWPTRIIHFVMPSSFALPPPLPPALIRFTYAWRHEVIFHKTLNKIPLYTKQIWTSQVIHGLGESSISISHVLLTFLQLSLS